jgi:hypothetical protein
MNGETMEILRLYKIAVASMPEEAVFFYSSLTDHDEMRRDFSGWDHGGSDSDKFSETLDEGVITEVLKLEDAVPRWGGLPYATGEEVFDGESLFELAEFSIDEYFKKHFHASLESLRN